MFIFRVTLTYAGGLSSSLKFLAHSAKEAKAMALATCQHIAPEKVTVHRDKRAVPAPRSADETRRRIKYGY